MVGTRRTIVEQVLRERGPMDTETLLAEARRAGAHLTDDALDELLHSGDIPMATCLPGDAHGLLDQVLVDRTFTHRLGAAEVLHDVLVVVPDLVMLADLLDEGATLIEMAGRPLMWASELELERRVAMVEDDLDPDGAIALPRGTLSGFAPETVLGIRLGGDGATVAAVEPSAAPHDLQQRIGVLLEDDPDKDESFGGDGDPFEGGFEDDDVAAMPVPISDLVTALCAADPELFTEPLLPVGELLEQFGFTVADGDVGEGDLDVDAWRATKDVARIAGTYGLGPEQAMAVAGVGELVSAAIDALGVDPDDADQDHADAGDSSIGASELEGDPGDSPAPVTGTATARAADARKLTDIERALRLAGVPEGATDRDAVAALTGPLTDPDTARALVAETVGLAPQPAMVLGALAEAWEPLSPRRSRVALRWIMAHCRESLGRVDEAETDFEAARELDPGWPPVLEDLARYADDRGDTDRAISLLRRAGVPDDDEDLEFLLGLQSPARTDLGRNQPCWCGSGRKYKVCHLGKEALPLESRVQWLYRKMSRFAQGGPFRYMLVRLSELRSAYDTDELALMRAIQDPLVIDATLFEGGAADEFVAERGFLLPDDERQLAQVWLLQERSVFQVEDVRVGRGFRVRNLRTGDEHDVTDKAASRSVRRGLRLLMRVVPVGDSWQIFGGAEPLPPAMESAALELCDALADGRAGPEELVSFVTSRFAPPEMRTTDGQPMVFCTGRYEVSDVAAVTAELDRRFDSDGHGQWSRTDGKPKHPTVLGSVELDGSDLTVSTTNEARFRMLQSELADIDGLVLIDVERTPATEMMKRAARDAGVGAGSRPVGDSTSSELEDNPEVRALLEDYARDYELQWLDMSIPALGGSTPRQAANDPTRREDLIRLLDSFDDIDARPGSMQVDRIRAALDL